MDYKDIDITIEIVLDSIKHRDGALFFVNKGTYNDLIKRSGQGYIKQDGATGFLQDIEKSIILKKHLKKIKYVGNTSD